MYSDMVFSSLSCQKKNALQRSNSILWILTAKPHSYLMIECSATNVLLMHNLSSFIIAFLFLCSRFFAIMRRPYRWLFALNLYLYR